MTKSSFVTTYRNDFLWPFVRTAPLRPGCQGARYTTVPSPEQALERGLSLEEYERVLEARRRCQEAADAALELDAVRRGPHAAAAVSPAAPPGYSVPAELQVARNDRADHNLRKLQEKHPYLFNIIRSCPPDDLVTRVFKDRYRSVYQVDYGKQGEYPNSEYDALVAGAGLVGSAPGALPFCPCRSARFSSDGGRMGVVSLDRNRQLQECEMAERAAASARLAEGNIEVCLCGLQPKGPQFGRKCTISCQPSSCGRRAITATARGDETFNPYHTEYGDSFNKLGSLILSESIHGGCKVRRPPRL